MTPCPMLCRRFVLPGYWLCYWCGCLTTRDEHIRWIEATAEQRPEVQRQIIESVWRRQERYSIERRD